MADRALTERERRILREIERDLQVDRVLDRQLREMRPKRVPGLGRGLRAFGRAQRGYFLVAWVLVSVWLILVLYSPAPAAAVALCALVWATTFVLLGLRGLSRLKSHLRPPGGTATAGTRWRRVP